MTSRPFQNICFAKKTNAVPWRARPEVAESDYHGNEGCPTRLPVMMRTVISRIPKKNAFLGAVRFSSDEVSINLEKCFTTHCKPHDHMRPSS